MNAQYQKLTAQNSYISNMILILIVVLAAVTLANTLITVAVERREPLRLLRRVGATSRQLPAMTGLDAADRAGHRGAGAVGPVERGTDGPDAVRTRD